MNPPNYNDITNSQSRHTRSQLYPNILQTYPNVAQESDGYPTAPQAPISISEKLNLLENEFELDSKYREKLPILSDFEIVLLVDDSGSMRTPLENSKHATRWDELKEVINISIKIATIFDENGIDIYFLNRNNVFGITDYKQMQNILSSEPYGRTPLTKKVDEIFSTYLSNQKPILLVIATDGIPTNDLGNSDIDNFKRSIHYKNHSKFYVSFLACSDRDDEIEYLNVLDRKVPNVDTLDDYLSEKKEVLNVQGKYYNYSLGDHVARLLLGPICPELDSLDEVKIKKKNRGCIIL